MAWYMLERSRCTSSQASGGAFLVISSSEEKSSGQSRSEATKGKYCLPGRQMAYSHVSRYGMMSRLSEWITRRRESISSISYPSEMNYVSQEASPASISASPERAQGSMESIADCGSRCSESLARYDRSTSSWRTPLCSLFGDYPEYSEALPKQGMTADGWLWELTDAELRRGEIGCGFLGSAENEGERMKRYWRTPDTCVGGTCSLESLWRMAEGDWKRPSGHRMQLRLLDQVRCEGLYPEGAIRFSEKDKGNLNPDWVEWLMGFPAGWTDLEPMSNEAFDKWKAEADSSSLWKEDPANTGKLTRMAERSWNWKQRVLALGNAQVPSCVRMSTEILEGVTA